MRCHRKSGSNSSARSCRSISPPVLWFARMQKYRRGSSSGRSCSGFPHGAASRAAPFPHPPAGIAAPAAAFSLHPKVADSPDIRLATRRRPAADLRDLQPRGRGRHLDVRHRHPRARPRRRLAHRARPLPPGHRRGRAAATSSAGPRSDPGRRAAPTAVPARSPSTSMPPAAAPASARRCSPTSSSAPARSRDRGPPRPGRPAEPGQRRRSTRPPASARSAPSAAAARSSAGSSSVVSLPFGPSQPGRACTCSAGGAADAAG